MVFCREVVQRVRPEIRQGPFLARCLAATIHGCWSGQANALILALVLLATVAGVSWSFGFRETDKADGTRSVPATVGHWWTAALLLAAAAHIKIWAVVVVALLALRWFRPLIPRFLAAFVLVGLLPLVAKTPAQVLTLYQQWLACLAERMAGGERWPGYRDAWTIWENLAPPVNRHVFSAMSLAAGLLAAAWCYRQSTGVGWAKQTAFLVGLRSRLDRFAGPPYSTRPWPTLQLDARFVLSVIAAWACWQTLVRPWGRTVDLWDHRPGGFVGSVREHPFQAPPRTGADGMAADRRAGRGRSREPLADGPADRPGRHAARARCCWPRG